MSDSNLLGRVRHVSIFLISLDRADFWCLASVCEAQRRLCVTTYGQLALKIVPQTGVFFETDI